LADAIAGDGLGIAEGRQQLMPDVAAIEEVNRAAETAGS
jgi:hypothetical protein